MVPKISIQSFCNHQLGAKLVGILDFYVPTISIKLCILCYSYVFSVISNSSNTFTLAGHFWVSAAEVGGNGANCSRASRSKSLNKVMNSVLKWNSFKVTKLCLQREKLLKRMNQFKLIRWAWSQKFSAVFARRASSSYVTPGPPKPLDGQ